MKLEISESESQRAERQIDRFYKKHGGNNSYRDLAAHAAYPFLHLTSDLVYCLRENFVPTAPWIAISDILLSPLCQHLGGDLYEMDPAVRMMLCRDYWDHDNEAHRNKLGNLNDFATQYLDSQKNDRLLEFVGDPEKFSWCKSGLTNFHRAADKLISKLEQSSKDGKYIDFFHWIKFYRIERNVVDYEFLEKILNLSVRWETSLGTATVDLDSQSLSEQLQSILPHSENLSVELDGDSIIVNSNKFNYMVFQNLVESDKILGGTPQIINIKRVLIVTSHSSLSRAISRAFNIMFKSLKTHLELEVVSGFENAISFLNDQDFDLVIAADNLEYSGVPQIHEGFELCDYISLNYPNTAKILIVSQFGIDTKDINHSIIDRYKLEGLFVFPDVDLKSLVQKSTILLEGIETNITYSPKQESVAVAPKTQDGRYNLVQILKKQKEQISNNLELLNQKINQLEIEEILTDHLPSKFELSQKISGQKKRRSALEQEIEELENRLSQAGKNTN